MQEEVALEEGVKRKGKGLGKAKLKTGKGAGKTGGEDGAKSVEVQVARMLVRAVWQQEWSAANPDKQPADRAAAWKEVRQARNETELKKMRRAVLSLKRSGVVMTLTPKAVDADDMPADDAADE